MSKPKTLIHQAKDILDQFCYAITERATKQAEAETLFNTRQQEIEADFARSQKQIEEAFVAEKARIEVEHLDRQRVVRNRLDEVKSSIKLEEAQKKKEIGWSFKEWLTTNPPFSSFFHFSVESLFIWCIIGFFVGIVVSLVAVPWIGWKYFLYSLSWFVFAMMMVLIWGDSFIVFIVGGVGFFVNMALSLYFKEWLAVTYFISWCLGGMFLSSLMNHAEQKLAGVKNEFQQKFKDLENALQRELSSLEQERTQRLNKAKDKYSNQLSSSESAKQGDFSDAQNNYQRNRRKIQDDFETWMSAIKGSLADLLRQVNQLSPLWTDAI